MDFRILLIGEKQVLLERVDEEGEWQVIISVFTSLEVRYDEWVTCGNAHLARSFIADFTDTSARQFLTRAGQQSGELALHAH